MTKPSQASIAHYVRPLRYYQRRAQLYNLSHKAFLFGRKRLVTHIAAIRSPEHILEVGCATGSTLLHLRQHFPYASLTGVDLSADMLAIAESKLKRRACQADLWHMAYQQPLHPLQESKPFDVIVFSYSLSMMHPGFAEVLRCAYDDLVPGGIIAVVDFHDTPSLLFKRWMAYNHVRMEGQVLASVRQHFTPQWLRTPKAYAGLWRYMLFIGEKPLPSSAASLANQSKS